MKELLELLQEVNGLIREERDSTQKVSKDMVAKFEGISFHCESNRRRLDLLHQKMNRTD